MSIFDVQHQPTAHAVVQQALLSGRLAHGLLLAGPSGVGKEMFATRLAALLLCPQPIDVTDGAKRAGLAGAGDELPPELAPPSGTAWRDACGRCDDCTLVAAGTHPDLHLVYRELHRLIPELKGRQGLELYIDVIRQFAIEPACRKSARGRGKVFIIRDAHLMNDEAQNALLKTLEEPPPGTFLVLLTDQAHRLLPTIRSRSQLVRFAPLPVEFVRSKLAGRPLASGRTIAPDEAAYLAGRSNGRLGEAIEMAEGDLFGLHQELATRLAALAPARSLDLADWLEEQINQLAKERVTREEITDSQAKKDVACQLLATAALVLSDAIRAGCQVRSPEAPALFPAAAEALAQCLPSSPLPLGEGERVRGSAEGRISAGLEDRMARLSRGIAALDRAAYLIGVRFVNPRLALDEAAVKLAEALAG